MSYRLIEAGSSTQESTLPNGQTFPVPALIKGEQNDLLVLLALGEKIPVDFYNAAIEQGCEIIYRQDPSPHWMLTDEYADHAVKASDGSYELPTFIWHPGVLQELFEAPAPSQAPSNDFYEDDEPVEAVVAAFGEGPHDKTAPHTDFVHLHCHSEFSALDGLATLEEIVKVAKSQGQTAIAITDHGVCCSHPALADICEKEGLKPIFGMEAYLVDDRFSREDAKDYMHITLWAMTDDGLRNLWAISTEGYRDGFHGHPRIDWDTLERLGTGVIASTGCLRGPLAYPWLQGQRAKAIQNSQRLRDIFGDRYYAELHANHLDDQMKFNAWLVQHADEFEIPLIAAVDSHYAEHSQRDDHQVWISAQIGKDVGEESSLFGGGQDYHMMSESEIWNALAYLGDATFVETVMSNTGRLAERCTAKITKRIGLPVYSYGEDAAEQDAQKMLDWCLNAWEERVGGKGHEEEYAARFEKEATLLIDKGFPGYFLMNADLVRYAKSHGVMVGPGRGSGAGSLVAYLMGIVEIDPVENDLMFERFMTKGRTALPDFDIDYPSSKKQFMIDYAESRWGKKHVCAVGTHTRLRNKGAFRDTARAIASRLPDSIHVDIDRMTAIVGDAEASTAGLGLSWDELMDVSGEQFEPYRETYPDLFDLAEKFRGRLKTYSRHAAGLVIDPQYNLEGALPMFLSPDEKTLVTQFDKDELEKMGFVKFDFLNLRNLDTIQMTVDLVEEQTGERIDLYRWRDEYLDADVFHEMSAGFTLGIFQLETSLGTRTIKRIQPTTLAHMSDSITVGRPGPIRSGLDETYFRRREGREKVTYADQRLAEVLKSTYGTMIYQENIMAVCIALAGYDDEEADYVRKILGKKKPEEAKKEGKKFIARAIETGTDAKVAEELWTQMEEFSRYSFNKAHAFAYAALAYWTAWLKYHYPVQFITACLSTIEQEEIPAFVNEARRKKFKVLPPDINDSREGFYNTATEVRYGLKSIKGIGDAATAAVMQGQPYKDFDDFMERKGDKCNSGHIKTLALIGAFDSIFSNRRALVEKLEQDTILDKHAATACIFYQIAPRNKYNDLPCAFDWDSEPVLVGKTGKPLKNQPKPAAKCTKACRHWTPREIDYDAIDPFTDEEIRMIEMEELGIYLSSSPFDSIPDDVMEELTDGFTLQAADPGIYLSAILITNVRAHKTKDGKPMRFVTADTPSGTVDITVFSDKLGIYHEFIKNGQMALAELQKNTRGVTLRIMEPL